MTVAGHKTSASLALTMLFGGWLQAENPQYVGSDACKTCHEELGDAFEKTPHQQLKEKACEACHGPGAKHAETADPNDIRNPAKLPTPAVGAICGTCHSNQAHVAGMMRTHANADISCITCHHVHSKDPAALIARAPAAINQECSSCHKIVWAQFQKPFHHRVPEDAMSCVDCHNPHGTIRHAALRTFAEAESGCFNCHGDKRGPFTFEHPPVRFEGCSACHESHGSVNPRMLILQDVRGVCLECHSNLPQKTNSLGVVPAAFHDLRSPIFQNCTVCHQTTHGSYVNRNFLQ